MNGTTIAAISTAQGTGGIAVIRISGDKAIEIADKVFLPANGIKLAALSGYSASYGHIYSKGEKIDEVIATVFISPHSYTGEDTVEFSCHGGIFITSQVLRTVLENGAVPAQAGEFTKRAFLNGKLDLTGAEAVMELIGAKSRAAARTALCLKEGALSRKIAVIKEELLEAAAHLNAWADYPEEDIAQVNASDLTDKFSRAEFGLEKLLSDYDRGQAVMEGVDTVIAGRPNVGKSTLMNLLSGREKSIVTDVPGTTRDVIEETVVLGNVVLKLSDTAGLRESDDAVEQIGIGLARKRLKTCGLVLAVFDGSSPLEKEDFDLIELIKDVPSIVIVNKVDLPVSADTEFIKKNSKYYLEISANDSACLENLTNAITSILGTSDFDPSQALLANERQRQSALAALSALRETSAALASGMTFDAVTVALEDSISALLELTGEKTSDLIIEKVFQNFCVGK